MLLVTIIAFFFSCLLGLFSGVLFLDIFFRAIISSVSVLVLGTVISFIVKKFLPSILLKDKSSNNTDLSADNDSSFPNKSPKMPEFQDDQKGGLIDVKLDEEFVPQQDNKLLNDEDSVNNIDFENQEIENQEIENQEIENQEIEIMKNPEVPLKRSHNRMTKSEDVFLDTNPDILARMIRTRLSDKD